MTGCPGYSPLGWLTDTLAKACDPAMQDSKNQACRPHRSWEGVVDSEFHCSKWTLFDPEERLLLLKARLGYTPLVEVNQAINAWSF